MLRSKGLWLVLAILVFMCVWLLPLTVIAPFGPKMASHVF